MRTVADLSDPELLAHFHREGSEMAFRVLVVRYQSLVLGAAYRRTGDHELARDVTQQVFAALAKKAGFLIDRGTVAGWLHQAAVYQSMRALGNEDRRRRKIAQFAGENQTQAAEPQSPRDDRWMEVDQAMDQLTPIEREALLLHYFRDLSYTEMAAKLGVPEATARKRVSRALAQLGGQLRQRGIEGNPITILTAAAAIQSALLVPAGTAQAALAAAAAGAGASSFLTLTALFSGAALRTVAILTAALVPTAWYVASDSPELAVEAPRPALIAAQVDVPDENPTASADADADFSGGQTDPLDRAATSAGTRFPAGGGFRTASFSARAAAPAGGISTASLRQGGSATTVPEASAPVAPNAPGVSEPASPTRPEPSGPSAPVPVPPAPVASVPPSSLTPVGSAPDPVLPGGTLEPIRLVPLVEDIASVYTEIVDDVLVLTVGERGIVREEILRRLEKVPVASLVVPIVDEVGTVVEETLDPVIIGDVIEAATAALPPELVSDEAIAKVLDLGDTVVRPILHPVRETGEPILIEPEEIVAQALRPLAPLVRPLTFPAMRKR